MFGTSICFHYFSFFDKLLNTAQLMFTFILHLTFACVNKKKMIFSLPFLASVFSITICQLYKDSVLLPILQPSFSCLVICSSYRYLHLYFWINSKKYIHTTHSPKGFSILLKQDCVAFQTLRGISHEVTFTSDS